MANPWFKFYAADYLNEVKLKGVSADRRSCLLTALCYSAVNEGVIDTRYLTNDILKMESGVLMGGKAWEDVGDVYGWLVEREIGVMNEHLFSFKNWFKRQESFLTGAERTKRYREKDHVTNVTLDKNREDKNREEVATAPTTPVFERKIREKDEEYRALVKDLAAKDYLSAEKIHAIVLDEFLPYWLERGENAKKARFEKEKAFDYLRRIRTWLKNVHRKDYTCSQGMWHREGERCYHEKPEVDYKSFPVSEFAKSLNKRI